MSNAIRGNCGTNPLEHPSLEAISTRDTLILRSGYIKKVRDFFSERGVLEAETNILSEYPALDPNIEPFATSYLEPGEEATPGLPGRPLYLHTSPEYGMKRLLSKGAGPIYQIVHVFRNGERGRVHNPEFTMLEWYRPGFSMEELMDEVSLLIKVLLKTGTPSRSTYRELFERELHLNPLSAGAGELAEKCVELKISPPEAFKTDRDALLQFLLSELIEPALGFDNPAFVYNFPPSQAALAKISSGPEKIAKRFELYLNGVELANGYNELTDPVELEERFTEESSRRRAEGKRELPPDLNLIAALREGLPDCSGVALGLDRLIMVGAGANSVNDILPLSDWKE